jgi:hypothetical protein
MAEDDESLDTAVIRGALRSRGDEASWSIAWGCLPPDASHVQVAFRSGRTTQPAARVNAP